MDVIEEEEIEEKPEPIPPGQQLMSALRRAFLYRPSLVNHQGGFRYWLPWTLIIGNLSFHVIRFLIGSVSPEVGLKMGNYHNVHGLAGQMISGSGVIYFSLILYFHVRLIVLEDIPFIHELVAYDNPEHETILSGEYRTKVITFITKVVKILKIFEYAIYLCLITIFVAAVVIPITILGFSIGNILFWFIVSIPHLTMSYYTGLNWIYVLGVWFLCKGHLDIQADSVIDNIDDSIRLKTHINIIRVANLDIEYKKLLIRVKKFDCLSKDLISPYRLVVSYFGAIALFATRQSGILFFEIGLDAIIISLYLVSLVFLYSSGSLSIRRRKMYKVANSLFVKMSRQRPVPCRSLFILSRMIKSLGSDDSPSICLTDKSGDEFDPMDFVVFIADFIANFFLVASLYFDFVKE